LTDQIRRAAVSVPSNIAEGQAHFNKGEFLHFLRHAIGSLAELETQLVIAERLQYAWPDKTHAILKQVIEVGKLLNGLISLLRK
jgi:four helix bundle protein